MPSSPLGVIWIENPAAPIRSGVWRYNRQLKAALAQDPRVRLQVSQADDQRLNMVQLAMRTLDGKPARSGRVPGPLRPMARLAAKAVGAVIGSLGLGSLKFFLPLHLPPPANGEVVHLTDQYLASGMTFVRRRPIVVTVHDIIPFVSESRLGMNLHDHRSHRWVYSSIVRNLRNATAIMADSEFTRQCLIESGHVPAEKITTVYCGVDHSLFQPGPVPHEFWSKLRIKPGTPIILHVSNEAPHKNFAALIRAFRAVVEAHPDTTLAKIGVAHSPTQRAAHLKLIEELRLTSNTVFVDDLTDEEMVYAYRAARVLVLPSLAEGFGLPVLEAMACGTPVICSNSWSLPEVAGEAAIIVSPQDVGQLQHAIERLLSGRSEAEALRMKGLERASSFTWERTAKQTIQVYETASQPSSR